MDSVGNYILETVKGIVSKPEEVKVSHSEDTLGVLFTVYVDPVDAGQVIGYGGETAKSIRRLARIAGYNQRMNASVKFDIPERHS